MNKKEISEIQETSSLPRTVLSPASADVTLTEEKNKKTELERSISLFIRRRNVQIL